MPALAAFRKFRLSIAPTMDEITRVFNTSMESVEASLRPLFGNPRAGSVVQAGITVGTSATVIGHKLSLGAGKTPNGWAITNIDSFCTVKLVAWDATTITLQASPGSCVVQLEVW